MQLYLALDKIIICDEALIDLFTSQAIPDMDLHPISAKKVKAAVTDSTYFYIDFISPCSDQKAQTIFEKDLILPFLSSFKKVEYLIRNMLFPLPDT